METKLTGQDSLRIINEMIEQTKNNIQKGSANTMIFAGYCVAITAILNFILMSIHFVAFHPSWVWLLMLPMTIGCLMMGNKREESDSKNTCRQDCIQNMVCVHDLNRMFADYYLWLCNRVRSSYYFLSDHSDHSHFD